MKALCFALLAVSAQAVDIIKGFTEEPKGHAGYIIELEPGTKFKRDTHASFYKRAEELAADYSVRHEFTDSDYFYGISIDASQEDAATLAALPEVKNVWPNKIHARPGPVSLEAQSPAKAEKRGLLSSRADKVTVPHVKGDSDINRSLKMAGVDKVHKQGITGKGVKIAVLDTGIDYRHPALGGGFGSGFKVSGGYDLVGDDYTGENMPVPDDDPLTSCLEGGHGTHVAGTIAGRDPKGVGFGLVGVAPDANILAYRIFGCSGGSADDMIMAGFERAGKDGADIISLSAGSDGIWETDSPYTTLLQGLTDKGVGIVVAAGNSGPRGPYFASSPAMVAGAVAVGSVANEKFVTVYNAKDSAGQKITFARVLPVGDGKKEFHVFVVPEDSECTAAEWNELIKDFPDKKRVIALIPSGSSCGSSYILDELVKEIGIGEIWTITQENTDFRLEPPGTYAGYEVAQITPAEAKKITDGLAKKGLRYTLTFKDQKVHDANQIFGKTMNTFSSYGPTVEMSLKPQISAPGGNILSTWPASDGVGYAVISGTSMATPFISGVFALLKSSDRSLSAKDIRARIQNSAVPLKDSAQNLLASTTHQGAGLVNALNAINYAKSKVTPSEINLRDSAKPEPQTITIENKGRKAKTYTLGHNGAALQNALPSIFERNINLQFYWSVNYAATYASVKFSQNTVTVGPRSKATVTVTVTPPKDAVADKLPLYAGYITLKSKDESLSVPYLGVPYARRSLPVLDTTNVTAQDTIKPDPPAGIPLVPSISNWDNSARNNGKETYTFANSDLPSLFLSVRQPSAYVRVDVLPVDTPLKPDFYGYDPKVKHDDIVKPPLNLDDLDNLWDIPSYGACSIQYGDPRVPVAGSAGRVWRGYGAARQYMPRPLVALNNGTIYELPNGDYRFVLRVLKWAGDWKKADDFETWLSPIVGVRKA